MTNNLCNACDKNINKNHKAVKCDICNQRLHIKCNLMNKKDFEHKLASKDLLFCVKCLENNIPFTKLTDDEFKLSITQGINTQLSEDNNKIQFFSQQQKKYLKNINDVLQRTTCETSDSDNNATNVNCNYYDVDEFTKAKFESNNSFSIFHMNIHSIQLHFEELKIMLQLLNFSFDILTITESKIEKNIDPIIDITLDGYHKPIGTPTEATKGGVLIYVSNKLNFKPRNDLNIYESKKIESMFIEVVNPKTTNTIIGTIYRHPCMSGDDFNNDFIRTLIQKLNNENDKKVYLSGDFNFDLLKVSVDPTSSDFFDTLTSNFLLPMISLPTKINSVNDSLIDNIFTNQFLPDTISGNITIGISDHLPSFIITPNANQHHLPKRNAIYRRNYKNFDQEDFLLDLLDIDWANRLEVYKNDPNRSFDNFYQSIESILDAHAPLKKISNKDYKRGFKPWITNGIITSIKRRNKLFNSYVKCKNLTRKSILHSSYKNLRNYIQILIKNSKSNFYKTYFTENNKNLRKIWQGIKSIINNKTKISDSPTCLIRGDKSITDIKDISNEFNSYFSTIADSILEKRKYHGKKSYLDYLSNPSSNYINDIFNLSDEAEIQNIISKIKK